MAAGRYTVDPRDSGPYVAARGAISLRAAGDNYRHGPPRGVNHAQAIRYPQGWVALAAAGPYRAGCTGWGHAPSWPDSPGTRPVRPFTEWRAKPLERGRGQARRPDPPPRELRAPHLCGVVLGAGFGLSAMSPPPLPLLHESGRSAPGCRTHGLTYCG